MPVYTIDHETNNIMAHASVTEAEAVTNSERFRSEASLAKLAANWPAARLAEIYNTLPGVTPVAKFKDRATGVARVWRAIQSLGRNLAVEAREDVAATMEVRAAEEQGIEATCGELESSIVDGAATIDATTADLDDELGAASQWVMEASPAAATLADAAPQLADVAPVVADAKDTATRAKRAPKAKRDDAPREPSKTSVVLALLRREGGVTAKELMQATGWQAHSVRGFLSGTIGKKMGLALASTKTDSGARAYSLPA